MITERLSPRAAVRLSEASRYDRSATAYSRAKIIKLRLKLVEDELSALRARKEKLGSIVPVLIPRDYYYLRDGDDRIAFDSPWRHWRRALERAVYYGHVYLPGLPDDEETVRYRLPIYSTCSRGEWAKSERDW